MIRVLGYAQSINVRKVLWTCDEIGVAYSHEADWGDSLSMRDPRFLKVNPKGLVPVLIDGQTILTESNTIVRYLASRFDRSDLLPVELGSRATVEQVMDWQATDFNASWRLAFQAYVRGNAAIGTAEQIAGSLSAWAANIGLVETELALKHPFICGASFTVADIVIGLSVNRYYQAPIPRSSFPRVEAYLARLKLRPTAAKHLGGTTN